MARHFCVTIRQLALVNTGVGVNDVLYQIPNRDTNVTQKVVF
jgi:hypothetical protein